MYLCTLFDVSNNSYSPNRAIQVKHKQLSSISFFNCLPAVPALFQCIHLFSRSSRLSSCSPSSLAENSCAFLKFPVVIHQFLAVFQQPQLSCSESIYLAADPSSLPAVPSGLSANPGSLSALLSFLLSFPSSPPKVLSPLKQSQLSSYGSICLPVVSNSLLQRPQLS